MNKQALGRLLKKVTAPIMESNVSYDAIIVDYGPTVPTATSVGYATGCIFLHTDGGAGTAFYINEGTAASCNFQAVAGLTAAQEALLSATAGTNTASKALIVDANKHLDVVETASLKLGASGSTTAVTATAAELNILDGVTATAAELNDAADVSAQDKLAPSSVIDGLIETYTSNVKQNGVFKKTEIYIDITGAKSTTTDLDIIGDTGVCHFGQITAAINGTILFGQITCLEAPATGVTDIDFYASSDGTGAYDADASALAGTGAILTKGGAWSAAVPSAGDALTALPAADEYLYLACGAAGTVGTYTAGKFLVELWGV